MSHIVCGRCPTRRYLLEVGTTRPDTLRTSLSTADRGLLALLILTWGVNWPVMKTGVEAFSPMGFSTLCMLAGVPILALIALVARVPLRVAREHRGELAWLALTNMTLWIVLSNYGVQLLSSGRAAIIAYTMPVWAAAIGIVLYGERPTPRLWIGVAAAFCGVALLLAGELSAMTGRPLGMLLMLGAAAVWGYGTHRMRRRTLPTHILAITFWSMVCTFAVCATIMAFTFERSDIAAAPRPVHWGAVLFNASVIFGFSQPTWFRLATILTPVASGLSVMLIPIVGLFSGMALLGEQPAWQDWIALAAILVAMGTVLLPARRR